jgi:hypothetical protein
MAQCCGVPRKNYVKRGVVVSKCRQCGNTCTHGKVDRAPESKEARMTSLKQAYQASLTKALIAKYDALFNYTAENETDVATMIAECLKKKKEFERSRQQHARTLEVPDAAKMLGIDVKKQLKTGNTATAHAALRDLEEKVWQIKYKKPLSGPKPPLSHLFWFDAEDL